MVQLHAAGIATLYSLGQYVQGTAVVAGRAVCVDRPRLPLPGTIFSMMAEAAVCYGCGMAADLRTIRPETATCRTCCAPRGNAA